MWSSRHNGIRGWGYHIFVHIDDNRYELRIHEQVEPDIQPIKDWLNNHGVANSENSWRLAEKHILEFKLKFSDWLVT